MEEVKMAAKGSKGKQKAAIKASGGIPKLKLTMPLDAKKIAAIHRCIAKGKLSITLSKVDLAAGKLAEAWLYD
jgi:hypothetical protein